MSSTRTSSNPSLIAILLVVQSRTGSGAEILFHYPPDPLSADRASSTSDSTDEGGGESSSSDSEDSSSEDDFDLFTKRFHNGVAIPQSQDDKSQNSDEEEGNYLSRRGTQDAEQWKPSWEPLLGLGSEGLVSLLAPGRAWHKRRFELGINDFVFLGRPVFAREDGLWQKPRRRRSRPEEEDATLSDGDNSEDGQKDADNIVQGEPPRSHLTMFHVVFVMDHPSLEHGTRVKEMYDHVVKKLSKVLKWAQAHQNYVWQQIELLQSVKATHFQQQSSTKTLYTELKQRSSLASAIAKVFDNISTSKIAAINLTSKISVSLQIPPITSTSYLPSLSEPPLPPGLWLTTATDTTTNAELDGAALSDPLQLSKNFTLLLKANPQKILKDIHVAGGPLALPLTNFIRHLKPTKSIFKLSVASQIALGDVQHLARHLVDWRRAIAIPPLHQRDTFIVSPNANMNKLQAACKTYDATFPMMPSLPKMLSALSGTPIPYGTLIPSNDHKEEYYRVLAWLMRDSWVTQLRTFALVRVEPEIKKAVRDRDRDEARGGTKTPVDNFITTNPGDTARSFGSSTPLPSFKQRPSMLSRPSSEGRQSISTDGTSMRAADQFKHNPKAASLVLSPQRASPEEARWLEYISSTIRSSRSSSQSDRSVSVSPTASQSENVQIEDTGEARRYWPLFVKYFTGAEALERIPVREGMKRKVVWDALGKMGLDFEGGVEDEKGDNKKVLVTVRHW